MGKVREFKGDQGEALPENFGSLKRYFLHFEGTFEQNMKV